MTDLMLAGFDHVWYIVVTCIAGVVMFLTFCAATAFSFDTKAARRERKRDARIAIALLVFGAPLAMLWPLIFVLALAAGLVALVRIAITGGGEKVDA